MTITEIAPPSGTQSLFERLAEMGHEQLVLCSDPSAGYRGIIAVHSTTLGPALGGTRFWNYASDEEAVIDAGRVHKDGPASVPLCAAHAKKLGYQLGPDEPKKRPSARRWT